MGNYALAVWEGKAMSERLPITIDSPVALWHQHYLSCDVCYYPKHLTRQWCPHGRKLWDALREHNKQIPSIWDEVKP